MHALTGGRLDSILVHPMFLGKNRYDIEFSLGIRDVQARNDPDHLADIEFLDHHLLIPFCFDLSAETSQARANGRSRLRSVPTPICRDASVAVASPSAFMVRRQRPAVAEVALE
jgi:hypothetical protein